MLLLVFIIFSQQSIDIETVRDSVVHQVVVGRFQDAIENAKSAIVREPNDCLLLGVIEYAFRRDIIHDLNNKFHYRISNIYPKEILKSWEKIYDKHSTSNNLAKLLVVVKALIDIDGSVAETQILFTDLPPFFEYVAEEAARKAKFEPATQSVF